MAMQRVAVPGFVGGSNTLRALQADCDRTVNLFTESTAPGTAKSQKWLQATPGFKPFTLFPDQPIRGMLEINDRLFVVGGGTFAEVFSDGTFGPTFSVAFIDPFPVSMASNGTAGNQVMIVTDGLGYIYNTNTLTFAQIVAAGFPVPVRMCDFMDGYFLVLKSDSRQFNWSALEDGTAWDSLDVAEVSEAADNITALIRNHREIWLLGFRTSEVWYDAGDVNNVFQPLQGVFIEHGALAPFTVRRCADTLIWLGQDVDGSCVIFMANGYIPQRVSTYAVDQDLQKLTDPTTATAFTFQMNGHTFYALIIPEADKSWLYDVTMNAWTEWNTWDSTHCVWMPKVVGTHAFAFNKHLVGDRFSGAIYELRMDLYDEQIVAPT